MTAEDLDAGMKHGAGWPMGPCELVDLVGIDVHVHASEALCEKTAGAANGAAAAPRRDGERGAARPQERPWLLRVRRLSRRAGVRGSARPRSLPPNRTFTDRMQYAGNDTWRYSVSHAADLSRHARPPAALAVPVGAPFRPRAPGDGTLVVKNGRVPRTASPVVHDSMIHAAR